MKPIKWAAKSAIEAATAIVKKIPDFASKVCKFLKSVPSKLPDIIPNRLKKKVASACISFEIYIKSLFAEATERVEKKVIVELADVLKKGFKTGKVAEEYLLKSLPGGKAQFRVANIEYVIDGVKKKGTRIVDVMCNGVAHESKVGYTTLTKRVKEEILKDVSLRKNKRVEKIVWHFYKSAVTKKAGPSKPLRDFLHKYGIEIINHF